MSYPEITKIGTTCTFASGITVPKTRDRMRLSHFWSVSKLTRERMGEGAFVGRTDLNFKSIIFGRSSKGFSPPLNLDYSHATMISWGSIHLLSPLSVHTWCTPVRPPTFQPFVSRLPNSSARSSVFERRNETFFGGEVDEIFALLYFSCSKPLRKKKRQPTAEEKTPPETEP